MNEGEIRSVKIERLRKILSDMGMSQYRLAKITEFSETYISSILHGRHNLSKKFAEKVCGVLPYDVRWLMAEDMAEKE